jgi:hypothetical protein
MIDTCIETIFRDRLRQLYDNLEKAKIEEKLKLDKYSYPFVPYVGRNYHNASPKVFYVGRATRGWGWDQAFTGQPTKDRLSDAVRERAPVEELAEIANSFVTKSIEERYAGRRNKYTYNNAPFWHWVYKLTVSIQRDIPQLFSYFGIEENKEFSRKCFSSIVWSNIFKISRINDNPDERMCKFLLGSTFNTLEEEFNCLTPDLIVFFTADSWDCYLEDTFHRQIRKIKVTDGVCRLMGVYDKAIVIRAPHPQGTPRETLNHLYDYLKKERLRTNW